MKIVVLLALAAAPYDFSKQIGVVVIKEGAACLSLPGALAAGTPVAVAMPNPKFTGVRYTKVAAGAAKEECHPLVWERAWADETAIAIGALKPAKGRDLDGDGRLETFKICASSEGLHLTVWTAAKRRWHAYHYLGYDSEANCTPAEMQPE